MALWYEMTLGVCLGGCPVGNPGTCFFGVRLGVLLRRVCVGFLRVFIIRLVRVGFLVFVGFRVFVILRVRLGLRVNVILLRVLTIRRVFADLRRKLGVRGRCGNPTRFDVSMSSASKPDVLFLPCLK